MHPVVFLIVRAARLPTPPCRAGFARRAAGAP
jgi:hypothetical protein